MNNTQYFKHDCIKDETTTLVWSPGNPLGAIGPFAINHNFCDKAQHEACALESHCLRFCDYEWWDLDGTPGPDPFTVCDEWIIRVGKYDRGTENAVSKDNM